MEEEIVVWEDEGGAPSGVTSALAVLTGTRSQVEWAGGIRRILNAEFDSVARNLRSDAAMESVERRKYVEAVVRILEDKRSEVMARHDAGTFINEWREFHGRIRRLVFEDPRYVRIKAAGVPESSPGKNRPLTRRD